MISLLICLLFITSCSKDDDQQITFQKDFVQLSTHKLQTYSIEKTATTLLFLNLDLAKTIVFGKQKKLRKKSATQWTLLFMTELDMENLH